VRKIQRMRSLEGRIGRVKKDCQAMRREGIIHHRERLYRSFLPLLLSFSALIIFLSTRIVRKI
jgi:hypothetical protein